MSQELKKYPTFYPPDLSYRRINDALIFSLDLSDALLPDVGHTFRQGMSVAEWDKYFDFSNIPNERFEEEYSAKLKQYTRPVEQFVGLIARTHNRILVLEGHLPGAKSIISSGFRRRFISNRGEDWLSANFAFSNAHLASPELNGPRLFIDNNILRLLTSDAITRNVLKLSCFSYRPSIFSPFNEKDGVFGSEGQWVETEIKNLTLLRKQYSFRHVNQNPLTYLQLLDKIGSILGHSGANDSPGLYNRVVRELWDPEVENKVRSGKRLLALMWPFKLDNEIDEFFDGMAEK